MNRDGKRYECARKIVSNCSCSGKIHANFTLFLLNTVYCGNLALSGDFQIIFYSIFQKNLVIVYFGTNRVCLK